MRQIIRLRKTKAESPQLYRIVPQFFVLLLCVWYVFSKVVPEVFAVVFYFCVGQLVEEYIVHQILRQRNKINIQVDIVLRRAAPPAGFLISQGNLVIFKAMFFGEVFKSRDKHLPGMSLINFRKGDFLFDALHLFKMLVHPIAFGMQKLQSLLIGNPARHSDTNIAAAPDSNIDIFSPAAPLKKNVSYTIDINDLSQ